MTLFKKTIKATLFQKCLKKTSQQKISVYKEEDSDQVSHAKQKSQILTGLLITVESKVAAVLIKIRKCLLCIEYARKALRQN